MWNDYAFYQAYSFTYRENDQIHFKKNNNYQKLKKLTMFREYA